MNNSTYINEKILKTLRILRKHPLMIIEKDNSYVLLQNYIDGYIDGLSHCLNKNLRKDITKWYKEKINVDTSCYWTTHIPFHFKGKSEEELKGILIDLTEEYFSSEQRLPMSL